MFRKKRGFILLITGILFNPLINTQKFQMGSGTKSIPGVEAAAEKGFEFARKKLKAENRPKKYIEIWNNTRYTFRIYNQKYYRGTDEIKKQHISTIGPAERKIVARDVQVLTLLGYGNTFYLTLCDPGMSKASCHINNSTDQASIKVTQKSLFVLSPLKAKVTEKTGIFRRVTILTKTTGSFGTGNLLIGLQGRLDEQGDRTIIMAKKIIRESNRDKTKYTKEQKELARKIIRGQATERDMRQVAPMVFDLSVPKHEIENMAKKIVQETEQAMEQQYKEQKELIEKIKKGKTTEKDITAIEKLIENLTMEIEFFSEKIKQGETTKEEEKLLAQKEKEKKLAEKEKAKLSTSDKATKKQKSEESGAALYSMEQVDLAQKIVNKKATEKDIENAAYVFGLKRPKLRGFEEVFGDVYNYNL